MLDRLARLAVTRPTTVVVAALVLLIAAAVYGSHVADRLDGGGFLSSSSESTRAADLLSQRFHAGKPNLVILATDTPVKATSLRASPHSCNKEDRDGDGIAGEW